MAGSRKTSKDDAQSDASETSADRIEDAVVIEETAADGAGQEDPAPDAAEVPDTATGEDSLVESERADDETASPETDAVTDSEAPERASEPVAEPAPRSEPPRASSGGLLPLVFGGVIAALIGFAASRLVFPDGWPGQGEDMTATIAALESRLAAQDQNLAALEAEAASLRAEVAALDLVSRAEFSAVEAEVSEQGASLVADLGRIEARVSELAGDLETLAMRPVPEGLDTQAFDAEIESFRADLTAAVEEARAQVAAAQAQAEAIAAAAAQEAAALEAQAAAEAAAREAEAEAAADRAIQRAALARVEAAIDNGEPYAQELLDLGDIAVPPGLEASANSGVATLPTLQAEFPEAARAALAASIRADVDGTAMDRAMAFLRVQTGARSLEPREGDDPDAILSRAEAALRDGDIAQALDELSGLPEPGLAEMSGWVSQAEARVSALTALSDLRAAVSTN